MHSHLSTRYTTGTCNLHMFAVLRCQTLDSAASDYLLQIRASGRSLLTIASYKESLTFLKDFFGAAMPLEAITANRLHDAVASLATTQTLHPYRRSETTLNRHRSAYRMFFSWTFQTGRTSTNPALQLCRSRAESIPTVPITADEVTAFLSAIRVSHDPLRLRDEALFATYAFAGLRRTEALLLNVNDFDAKRGVLHVRNGKGRHSRTVPITRTLSALLSMLGEARLPSLGTYASKLFPGRSPHIGLTPRQAQRRFEFWRVASGLRPILTIHSFRAGFATRLHHHSQDIVLVARALGHRDIRITLRYLEMNSRNLAGIIESTFG